MRDRHITNIARALPRMSWTPKNLFNLYQRAVDDRSPKARDINFRKDSRTLFQQRWISKAVVRAYHGDHINERLFKRWYLPGTLPDVRPRKKVFGDDEGTLLEFAKRRQKERNEDEAPALAPVGSLMFAEVERRLDVLIFRSCFAHSVYDARRLVVHGKVLLNGKRHYNANTRLAPGDMFAVKPDAIRFLRPQTTEDESDNVIDHPDAPKGATPLTPFNLPFYASPWLFVPAYLEVNYGTCAAVYVRHPTARPNYSEIPTPYDADGEVLRHAWEWYMRHRPRVRTESQWAKAPDDRLRRQMEELRLGRHSLRFATSTA
ncbi:hypothetical protein B0H15DRAFT_816745 [Mycena belliarum]|uniref:RNA-binding S4 domain-containing protein n=1 Tax=Mycena belliarum TaxID=1033014 RepID=A0AAD6UEI1_9AGAR|nr:hypothetical protein B0H15DRAFT_816745 [Mycena belliae]